MTPEEAKQIKPGSCPACWPFLCDPDLRECDGTCGRALPVRQLRRRAFGWFCISCDGSRPKTLAELPTAKELYGHE